MGIIRQRGTQRTGFPEKPEKPNSAITLFWYCITNKKKIQGEGLRKTGSAKARKSFAAADFSAAAFVWYSMFHSIPLQPAHSSAAVVALDVEFFVVRVVVCRVVVCRVDASVDSVTAGVVGIVVLLVAALVVALVVPLVIALVVPLVAARVPALVVFLFFEPEVVRAFEAAVSFAASAEESVVFAVGTVVMTVVVVVVVVVDSTETVKVFVGVGFSFSYLFLKLMATTAAAARTRTISTITAAFFLENVFSFINTPSSYPNSVKNAAQSSFFILP